MAGNQSAKRTDRHGHFRKAAIPGAVKRAVVERVGARPGTTSDAVCYYCDAPGSIWWPLTYTGRVGSHMVLDGLEFDHVYPEFHGGTTTADNMVLACPPCNRSKRDTVL